MKTPLYRNLIITLILISLTGLKILAQNQLATKADSLFTKLKAQDGGDDVKLIDALFSIYFPRDLTETEKVLNRAEEIIRSKPAHDLAYLQILTFRGNLLSSKNQMDSMALLMRQGIQYADSTQNQKYIGSFENNLGIYHERTGSLDSAIYYYKKSIKSNPSDAMRAYNNLGRALQRQGNLTSAIEYMAMAMIGAQEKGMTNGVAIIANNIGSCYHDLGNLEKAKDYFLKSIALKDSLGDERGKLFALTNIIECLEGDSLKKIYIDEGLSISKRLNQKNFISNFTQKAAVILTNKGKHKEAFDLLKPIYDSLDVENQQEKLAIKNSMAGLYFELGDYEIAENISLEVLKVAAKLKDIRIVQQSRFNLMSIFKSSERFKKYSNLASQYITTKDSLQKVRDIEKFAELERKLDAEQKQKVELLNLTIQQEERSKNRLIIIGLLIGLLLIAILYFRSRKIKLQNQIIKKESETAKRLESINLELQDLNRFKSKLYTNISHEFRTPLTVIMGISKNLKEEDTSYLTLHELHEKYELIHRNGANLLELVNQLLDLNKIETKTLKVHYQQGNIIQEIKYLSESFESLLQSKGIKFLYSHDINNLTMDIDVEKIRQIIFNLLSNAIKYTPVGGEISIHVTTEKNIGESNQSFVKIKVKDNGAGISEHDLDQIFERFYQGKNLINKTGGTGIGLSLTKELVELLKGKIEVESVENEGSTFHVFLPILNNSQPSTEAQTTNQKVVDVSDKPNEINIPSGLPKLLIIEDNIDVSNYIHGCLYKDFEIHQSFNGQDGVVDALKIIPDLVISDIMMPLKDGFTVCDELKSNELTSHIPIILLTAKADHSSKLEGLSKGADDYLIKPFDTQELEIRVHNLIEIRKRLQEKYSQAPFMSNTTFSEHDIEQRFLKKACEKIMAQLDNGLYGVEDFASDMTISKVHLNRKLKALTDLSANKFIQTLRLQKAKEMLESGEGNVNEVAIKTGFNSTSYFVKCFREKYDQTPSNFLSS